VALEGNTMSELIAISMQKYIGNKDSQNKQFSELLDEINYANKMLISKKWNLAQHYNHMADFHDYIDDPAPNLRILADKWLQEHSG